MSASTRAVAPRAGWRRFRPTRRQLLVAALAVFLVLVGLVALAYATTTIPQPSSIVTAQSTIVYYSDGRTPIGRLGSVYRVNVPLSQVPVPVQQTVLAAEDRHYYSEPGISPTGILRALWVDVSGGGVQQGGSTITQQYAKNAYLTQQRTFSRKLREIFLAVKLDHTHSKRSVLQDYLNTVYFGRGAYGIEAAAQVYFHADVSKLDAAQGAVLAALIRSPSGYDPSLYPQAAHARWHYVIDGMLKMHWLTPAQAAALAYPKVLPPRRPRAAEGPNGYILDAVKNELARHGFDEARLAIGGYRVVTTLDAHGQRAAVDAEQTVLGNVKPVTVSALVSIDPSSGAIRAMYGGRDYANPKIPASFLNLATDVRRQPGSSFKPYTLITALEQHISLNQTFDGTSPKTVPGYGTDNTVRNDNNEQCPHCTLTKALARSINTVFVPLALQVGPAKVRDTAYAAGVSRKNPLGGPGVGADITLGTHDVRVIDQAIGFSTIAAQGVRSQPYLVQSVSSGSGNRLYTAQPHRSRVFGPAVMSDATYAMQQVLDDPQGTAHSAQLAGNRPAAGKTGTTTNSKDAWFIGFTPQLCTAVWMGNADGTPLTNVPGYSGGVYGGTLPAQVWKQYMDAALANQPVLQFPKPAKIGTPSNSPSPTPTKSSPSPTPTKSSPAPHTTSPLPTTPPTTLPPATLPPSTPPPSSASASPTAAPAGGGGGGGAAAPQASPSPTR